jgi:hypothetical protein
VHTRSRLRLVLALATTVIAFAAGAAPALRAANCGPFNDVVDSDPFCPSILQIYYMGITAGTSVNTFGPTVAVTRQVLAAMLARGGSGATTSSSSRRPALGQFWTTKVPLALGRTDLAGPPNLCKADGADIWVPTYVGGGAVTRVRASDGKLLETWTGMANPIDVLSAMGKIFVVGSASPGVLYRIDPSQPPGAVPVVSATLGNLPSAIAFDGTLIYTASPSSGTISAVVPGATDPWVTATVGSYGAPFGMLYDGSHIWVTDTIGARILKLTGFAIEQDVPVGNDPKHPAFDGTNIWVPNYASNSVTVVRASTGAVIATLTDNGLNNPYTAAYDGQRVLVTNASGQSVSVWRAADLAPLGSTATGAVAWGACSDGVNFWITLGGVNQLARF